MTTKADILAAGRRAMAELATRPRRAPQTADEANSIISEMRLRTKSRSARIKMAEMALKIGNISPEAREVWQKYLSEVA